MSTAKLGDEFLFIDGGLSTELEALGEDLNSVLWSAYALLKNPDAIYKAHKNYFDAGANVAITSTYQASLEGFQNCGVSFNQAKKLMRLSIELADQARRDFLNGNPNAKAYVAASIGPFGAFLADGSEYRGGYSVSADKIRKFHSSRIESIQDVAEKFDFWAVETLPGLEEALLVADLLGEDSHPAWFSFTLRDQGHIAEGRALAEVVSELDKHDTVAAIGVNCCHPGWVEPALNTISEHTSKPLLAYPNSGGDYDPSTKVWVRSKELEFDVASWIATGARLIGGCCQTSSKSLKPLYSDWTRLVSDPSC